MDYRVVGKSGLKVSEIGLGSSDFGGRIDEQRAISVVRQSLEVGINLIDTSGDYNQGRSEEFVGKAIKGKRSEVIIATKFGGAKVEHKESGASRYHIMKAIDASLKRLNTDYVDLYYLHGPDDLTTPIEETLRTLDDLIRAGKVRYIGCSNFSAWQLCEALWNARLKNQEPFIVVQPPYNMLNRSIEAELVPCCQAYGIGVIPYWPLAEGVLTGNYQRGKPAAAGTHLADPRFKRRADLLLTEANFDRLERLQAFATEFGHSIGELAIAWLLSHSWLSSVIGGAEAPEQVSANVAAANWKLTASEVVQVEQLL